jgi:hypothetical protein
MENTIIPFDSTKAFKNLTYTLDKNSYKLVFRWNGTANKWVLNIEGITNDIKVNGIALITGQNLLKPFAIKELGGLYIIDNQETNTDPTRTSLGNQHKIQYVVKENTSEII